MARNPKTQVGVAVGRPDELTQERPALSPVAPTVAGSVPAARSGQTIETEPSRTELADRTSAQDASAEQPAGELNEAGYTADEWDAFLNELRRESQPERKAR